MRVYSQSTEENVRDQALVRDWVRSGLLNIEQGPELRTGLNVALRQTNPVLRAVLFLFTLLIVIASVGLTLTLVDFSNVGARIFWESAVFALWAGIGIGLAVLLATKGRLYRYGVEEALAIAAVVLLMFSVGWGNQDPRDRLPFVVGALGSFGIYSLFGFRYALVGAAALAGMIPFGLPFDSRTHAVAERVVSVLILALIFYRARRLHQRHRGEITGDDWAAAQVLAFGGIYFVLNLMISRWLGPHGVTSGVFYWCTYVLVWIVPPAGLWLGIRERDRLMINAGSITALATLMTNKAYLGWPHHAWDPILLGVVLMGTALALRRWLAEGPSGARYGFTPTRTLESENRALAAAGAISLALPHPPGPGSTELQKMKPGGGESGGGGASGSF